MANKANIAKQIRAKAIKIANAIIKRIGKPLAKRKQRHGQW